MTGRKGGAGDARRWGKLVAGAALAALMAGCAAGGREARLPPDGCSRSKARPANPHGSVLVSPAEALSGPDAADDPADVMIFGDGASRAPEAAGDDLGRPISAAPRGKDAAPRRTARGGLAQRDGKRTDFGSC